MIVWYPLPIYLKSLFSFNNRGVSVNKNFNVLIIPAAFTLTQFPERLSGRKIKLGNDASKNNKALMSNSLLNAPLFTAAVEEKVKCKRKRAVRDWIDF